MNKIQNMGRKKTVLRCFSFPLTLLLILGLLLGADTQTPEVDVESDIWEITDDGNIEITGGEPEFANSVDMQGNIEEAYVDDGGLTDEGWYWDAESVDGSDMLFSAEYAPVGAYESDYWYPEDTSHEMYAHEEINGFLLVRSDPLSTFSADVDTASYANVRRMIEDGWSMDRIYQDAVRVEEFVNYFSYDLEKPAGGEKFGVTTKLAACPWNKDHQLLMIGIATEEIDLSEAPAENLTFLIDVSGSMDESDKLPLLQQGFLKLVDELDEDDTVSIVTYANNVEVVLDSVKGSDKETIRKAIEGLVASGGTYGEGGIQKAYELARENFAENGNNRVILATDGDLNIGISDPDELEKLITDQRDSGIYLSVLGFGTWNIRDDNMERLADCGNGNYSYIDSLLEARKVLVEEMGATLHTVAEDVKLQVEFNPANVNAYRLLGYENRLMEATDFRDDTKDAGEIGAGHTVVALYELIPAGSEAAVALKYQDNKTEAAPMEESGFTEYRDEYATVSIRYKEPGETTAQEFSHVVKESDFMEEPDDDFIFASLVAEFAMILRGDENKGTATLEGILDTYRTLDLQDEYKDEFFFLVRMLAKQQ